MPHLTTNLFFQYKCYSLPIFYKHTDAIDKAFVYRESMKICSKSEITQELYTGHFLQSHDPHPSLHNPKGGTQ